jgi:hypothetical protein
MWYLFINFLFLICFMYLDVYSIKFMEELSVEQVTPCDVIIRWQLFANKSWIYPVYQCKNAFCYFPNCLRWVV